MADISKIVLPDSSEYNFKDATSGYITKPNAPYLTCATAAATAAKTTTLVSGTFTSADLVSGAQVLVKFTNANGVASPTLSVNSTTAKSIKRYGTTAPSTSAATSWNAGSVVLFTYDGTYWQQVGYLNSTYSEISAANITNGTGSTTGLVTGRRAKAAVEAFAPVTSVNTKTGAVSLTASDVGALADSTTYVSSVNGSSGAVTVQETLVSGTNIKTINNNSLLGSGDITISGGTDTKVTQTETIDNGNYEILLSGTPDDTTRTEEANKSAYLTLNPSTGELLADTVSCASLDSSAITIDGNPVPAVYDLGTITVSGGVWTPTAQQVTDVTNMWAAGFCAVTWTDSTSSESYYAFKEDMIDYSGVPFMGFVGAEGHLVPGPIVKTGTVLLGISEYGYGMFAKIADLDTDDVQTQISMMVPAWALDANKPTYTASEVGALATTGGQLTGTVTLYSASGDSPAIIFQRGTLSDNYNDWRIIDSGGFLHFAQRGQGSTAFSDQVVFNTTGNISATSFSGSGSNLTGVTHHATTTVTLASTGWSSSTYTASVTGVTASNTVIVSPDPASYADYVAAGIYCSAQAAGTLTFTCTTTPTSAITVNVVTM